MSHRSGGERVLIYGASSAIAQEVGKIYAARGAKLALVGRDELKLQVVAGDFLARGALCAKIFAGDLSDPVFQKNSLLRAAAELSTIDIVLVAQGVLGDQAAAERDPPKAAEILMVNFTDQALLLLSVASYFESIHKGTIAVISSVAGDRGRQSNFIYGSAKAGMTAFLQGLRNRLFKHGVHVITIKPGMVATPMTAHLRQGPLFANPAVVARGIFRAIQKGCNVIYVPGYWCGIMAIIRAIPERLFKRLSL